MLKHETRHPREIIEKSMTKAVNFRDIFRYHFARIVVRSVLLAIYFIVNLLLSEAYENAAKKMRVP